MEYCVQLWLSHFNEGVKKLQRVQQTAAKVTEV